MHNSKKQGKEILKICNHPFFYQQHFNQKVHQIKTSKDFNIRESGKMIILEKLLEKLKKKVIKKS